MRISRAGLCIAIAVGYVVLRFAVLWMRSDLAALHVSVLGYVALLMLAQIGFVVCLARMQLSLRSSLLLLLPTAVATAGLIYLQSRLGAQTPVPVMALFTVSILHGVSLMTFAGTLGYTVSYVVREPNILLPAAVFAGIVDYWSVTWGPLSRALEHKPEVVESVSVQMPLPSVELPGAMIGMGDFVFLGIFFGVLYRFSMNTKGAFWLGYALLTASILIVMRFGGALPALVPMAIAIVGANIHNFKLRREELLATLYVGVMVLVLLVVAGVFLFRG